MKCSTHGCRERAAYRALPPEERPHPDGHAPPTYPTAATLEPDEPPAVYCGVCAGLYASTGLRVEPLG